MNTLLSAIFKFFTTKNFFKYSYLFEVYKYSFSTFKLWKFVEAEPIIGASKEFFLGGQRKFPEPLVAE